MQVNSCLERGLVYSHIRHLLRASVNNNYYTPYTCTVSLGNVHNAEFITGDSAVPLYGVTPVEYGHGGEGEGWRVRNRTTPHIL